MNVRALAALPIIALVFSVAPAEAQLPGLCLPGVPIPGVECTPAPDATSTPLDSPTPDGTTTPGTTATPSGTTTPSGTVTATPTVNPAATPVAGGSVSVIAQSDVHGTDGEATDAGQFRIHNSSGNRETISSIRVGVTEPAMFTSMTLTADGQAVTISDPSEDNTFFFDPDLEIAQGDSIDVTLTVQIGAASSGTTATATPEGSTTPSETSTPQPTITPNPFAVSSNRGPGGPQSPSPGSGIRIAGLPTMGMTALLAVALACAALTLRSRRLGIVVTLLLIAIYAGCGSEQTSTQTVAGITASNGSGPVTMSGLPASLGTVSRPQPLLFPGAAAR